MKTTNHVSVEELTGNLADLLNQVRLEQTSLVVEYATGEQLIIQPHRSTAKKLSRSAKTPKAATPGRSPLPSTRLGAREDQMNSTQSPPPSSLIETGEANAPGAAYELDPKSVTPG